jgi:hypothetical protein
MTLADQYADHAYADLIREAETQGIVIGVTQERKRIADAIRQMQKSGGSNFISGNELIDVVYNQKPKDTTNTNKGWD